ncbi:MAG: sulfotransferase domain-containing protein [Cyanobacteria bacterium J06635_10]
MSPAKVLVAQHTQALEEIGKPIIIVTHPRSGTHLTIDLLRKQFQECRSWLWFGETLHHSYLNLDHLAEKHSPHINQQQALNILHRAKRPIIKTHSLPGFKELSYDHNEFVEKLMENADLYYVVRDGRDVLCSVHLWAQQSNRQARCSLSEFIRQEENGMSRPKIWANHIHRWLEQPNIKVLKFEQNVKDTRNVVAQIGKELGIKPLYMEPLLPIKRQSGSRWEDYLLRLTRQFESTTIVGRYNGKKPEKWQEAFTYEDCEFFHREAGDLLISLGYEVSDAWVKTRFVKS